MSSPMIDDDVQYLGSRLNVRDNLLYPHRALTGAALHIEKSDANEAYSLTYDRQHVSTVYVGRKPGNEPESRSLDQEKGRAMFRCAVVSRRHAKIAFSDSGNVYLIDLGSHHGTHVRKPGETSSKMLERDVPAALSDGDMVTFGKTVGRNEEVVRPIVARVQLIYGSASTSPIKPLVVPDSPSLANRSHTGRYGLRSPSSSSSDEAYNGQSDSYSDVEAETPPPPPPTTSLPEPAPAEPKPESHFGRAIEVLKRFLPPSAPPAPSSSHASIRSSSPRLDEQSPYNSHSPSPIPGALPSPSCALPSLPHFVTEANSTTSPLEGLSLPPLHLNPQDMLRSESPMELASSSSSPSVPDMEPHIVGTWDYKYCFLSPPPMVEDVGEHLNFELNQDHQAEGEHESTTDAADVVIPVPPWSSPNKGKEKEKEKEADNEHQTIDTSLFVNKSEYEDLKAKYVMLQDEISDLQTQRRKYKAKFNSNVHTVTDKFLELEDKMNDMSAQCTLFMDQIENVTYRDVPDLQTRIDDLLDEHDAEQMEVGRLRMRLVDCEEKMVKQEMEMADKVEVMEEGKEKVQGYLDTLRGFVEEMKTLRNTAEREVKEEVETLRQIRKTILEEANATIQASLKRKRSIEDDGAQDADVDATTTAATTNDARRSRLSGRPRHKRPRRFVSIVAQTATAITMGAVATWAALAFY